MRNSTLKFCAMLLAICTSAIHLQAMDEWDGTTIAQGFYSGTGTKTDPYRIFTASQFLYFLQQTKDGNTFSGKYIELCNDIAFNHKPVSGGNFYGEFDGNDHTIQVNKYWSESDLSWTLLNLYGSMYDVQFVRANQAIRIYTGGILYNCRFDFPKGNEYPSSYHGKWTVYLDGGTIANCVSNSADFRNKYEGGGATGFVSGYNYGQLGYCSNCYFPIESYSYGNTLASNYCGVIESCGEEAGNDWVLSHTERAYKSWPLTFSPTYPEYQIQEQPKSYNPSVVCPNSDKTLFQWHYQERKPITFEDIPYSSSTQTKNVVVLDDDAVLSFYFEAHGYRSGRYNDNYHYAWISVNGEEIVHVYDERAGTYSCQASAGSYEISCELTDISNIRITYPVETLTNETSSTLSKQTIMEKPGAYFCQVSYGEGCDVMNSDYVDYEKLLTIDNVTYVVNEDSTATVLWAADMAVDITIPETVNYNDVNYPVTSISSKAFVDCTSLTSIKCKTSDALTLLGGTTFEGTIPSNVTLYVSAGSESAYSAAEGWKEFDKISEMEFAVELVDGQTFDNDKERIVGEIIYSRNFKNTSWQALYVPFEIPYENIKDDFVVAYINDVHQFDDDDDGAIDRTQVEAIKVTGGILKANYPYMIRARWPVRKSITVTDATLYATEENSIDCSSVFNTYSFTGTYSKIPASELPKEEGYYALSGGAWKHLSANSSLGAFRMYMKIDSRDANAVVENRAIEMRVIGDDEEGATGVENPALEAQKSEFIYDLQGRRVENPTKGLYIVDGRKVWIE